MKLFLVAPTFLALLAVNIEAVTDPIIGEAFGGCIEPLRRNNGVFRVGRGSKVILGEEDADCVRFTFNPSGGFLVLEQDDFDYDLCLQAGHGGALEDGSKMRLYRCDGNDFQKFTWENVEPLLVSGSLKPESNPDLCVVYRGVTANIGVDPIIFKECDRLDDTRSEGWFIDN